MENLFKRRVNEFIKNAKLAGLGMAIGASSLNDANAQNIQNPNQGNSKNKIEIFKNEETLPPIIVHDKNDPRLKEYEDSLKLYNLTNYENFESTWDMLQLKLWGEGSGEGHGDPRFIDADIYYPRDKLNQPNPTKGPYGSKIEYSITKKPLYSNVVDKYKNHKSYVPGKFQKLLQKHKPIGYKNRSKYDKHFTSSYFNVSGGKNSVFLKPVTDSIEDNINRSVIKRIFPEMTDADIDKKVKEIRENPYYGNGGSLVGAERSFREKATGENASQVISNKDVKQESIREFTEKIEDSYPIYAKPKQPVIYQDLNAKPKQENITKIIPEKPKIITKPKLIEKSRKYLDSKFFGYNDNDNIIGYYNKGDGKGRIDVTFSEAEKMTEENFSEMFPEMVGTGWTLKKFVDEYRAIRRARQNISDTFLVEEGTKK